MIDDKTLAKMEDARHLLEPPADKVVGDLLNEIAALKADNERMAEAITEWARSFGLAAPMWKEQPVNMALFKIAAQRREGGET